MQQANLPIYYIGGALESSCHRSTALRSGSLLSGKKITFVNFVHLLFWFSVKGLGGSSISELSGLGEDTVTAWRKILTDEVTCWFTRTSKPIGGEGTFVEIDEAKFRRMKHHRGAARAETWIVGGVQRDTNDCFLVPCPGGKRSAEVLLPIIQRWVLPGTTIHTDGWRAYRQLSERGYHHDWVNHTLHFVDTVTGCHTNRQEGLWKHVRDGVSGSRSLEDSFVDFLVKRKFTFGGCSRGTDRIVRVFNGYLAMLKLFNNAIV